MGHCRPHRGFNNPGYRRSLERILATTPATAWVRRRVRERRRRRRATLVEECWHRLARRIALSAICKLSATTEWECMHSACNSRAQEWLVELLCSDGTQSTRPWNGSNILFARASRPIDYIVRNQSPVPCSDNRALSGPQASFRHLKRTTTDARRGVGQRLGTNPPTLTVQKQQSWCLGLHRAHKRLDMLSWWRTHLLVVSLKLTAGTLASWPVSSLLISCVWPS